MGKKADYISTFKEEVGNSVSHGSIAFITLLLIPFSAVYGFYKGGITFSVGISIFVISVFLMFLSSTLYHAMSGNTKHKSVFRILDHIFIYVAIAGSYTPIALCVIKGWQGIVILSVQWAMVLFGVLYKSISKNRLPKVSLTIYLVMGWTLVLFLPMFLGRASSYLILFIVLGGIFYSSGAFFYAKKGFVYHHMVWHLFVNLGAASHYVAIVFFLYN
jgi:hemolysin III